MSEEAVRTYVLSVMSDDHPGIVSAVTGAIGELQGNITSCSQTVVEGYFTLIMIASFPASVTKEAIVELVEAPSTNRGQLQVIVQPYREHPTPPMLQKAERFVVTAFGADKPGIIRGFTRYLADKEINIIDLYGDLRGEEFVLITQVEMPTHWSVRMIQADLEEMGAQDGFTVRFQHENVFVATNQLRLTPSQG